MSTWSVHIYGLFDFEFDLELSTRPEARLGDDKVWDKAEKALLEAVKATKLKYTINKGEGAFYGPKIEFVLRDAIGRDWQCGTVQVDLNLPGRLDATYVDKDGTKKVPVMLHRALFGSLERFIGILIENYAGKFPFWISPLQTVVIPISDDFNDYARLRYLLADLIEDIDMLVKQDILSSVGSRSGLSREEAAVAHNVPLSETDTLHLDEILPVSKGGDRTVENTQFLDAETNINMSDRIK